MATKIGKSALVSFPRDGPLIFCETLDILSDPLACSERVSKEDTRGLRRYLPDKNEEFREALGRVVLVTMKENGYSSGSTIESDITFCKASALHSHSREAFTEDFAGRFGTG